MESIEHYVGRNTKPGL